MAATKPKPLTVAQLRKRNQAGKSLSKYQRNRLRAANKKRASSKASTATKKPKKGKGKKHPKISLSASPKRDAAYAFLPPDPLAPLSPDQISRLATTLVAQGVNPLLAQLDRTAERRASNATQLGQYISEKMAPQRDAMTDSFEALAKGGEGFAGGAAQGLRSSAEGLEYGGDTANALADALIASGAVTSTGLGHEAGASSALLAGRSDLPTLIGGRLAEAANQEAIAGREKLRSQALAQHPEIVMQLLNRELEKIATKGNLEALGLDREKLALEQARLKFDIDRFMSDDAFRNAQLASANSADEADRMLKYAELEIRRKQEERLQKEFNKSGRGEAAKRAYDKRLRKLDRKNKAIDAAIEKGSEEAAALARNKITTESARRRLTAFFRQRLGRFKVSANRINTLVTQALIAAGYQEGVYGGASGGQFAPTYDEIMGAYAVRSLPGSDVYTPPGEKEDDPWAGYLDGGTAGDGFWSGLSGSAYSP